MTELAKSHLLQGDPAMPVTGLLTVSSTLPSNETPDALRKSEAYGNEFFRPSVVYEIPRSPYGAEGWLRIYQLDSLIPEVVLAGLLPNTGYAIEKDTLEIYKVVSDKHMMYLEHGEERFAFASLRDEGGSVPIAKVNADAIKQLVGKFSALFTVPVSPKGDLFDIMCIYIGDDHPANLNDVSPALQAKTLRLLHHMMQKAQSDGQTVCFGALFSAGCVRQPVDPLYVTDVNAIFQTHQPIPEGMPSRGGQSILNHHFNILGLSEQDDQPLTYDNIREARRIQENWDGGLLLEFSRATASEIGRIIKPALEPNVEVWYDHMGPGLFVPNATLDFIKSLNGHGESSFVNEFWKRLCVDVMDSQLSALFRRHFEQELSNIIRFVQDGHRAGTIDMKAYEKHFKLKKEDGTWPEWEKQLHDLYQQEEHLPLHFRTMRYPPSHGVVGVAAEEGITIATIFSTRNTDYGLIEALGRGLFRPQIPLPMAKIQGRNQRIEILFEPLEEEYQRQFENGAVVYP